MFKVFLRVDRQFGGIFPSRQAAERLVQAFRDVGDLSIWQCNPLDATHRRLVATYPRIGGRGNH